MIETVEKTFSFAEFELDTAKRLLLKAGQPLALNPKAFDLLTVLVNKHGQIVSKDELLETVWEGSFVEENNLTVHISALRKIFGEKKNEHQFIATIPGKGYKFVAEIRNGNENFLVKVNELPRNFADGEGIIGRKTEIAEIKHLFRHKGIDLITLTGAGGAGKTSLAQTVGNELKTDFADGVFFVELAAVRSAELVAPTIMQTLGANESGVQNYVEILKSFLRTRQILLILDNFEQIAVAAPLVGELLESSAKLRILITSRVALHLESETEFPVNPLRVPPPNANLSLEKLSDYASFELFVKRAKTIKPNFNLNEENARAIAGICTKLDGLPLAIELAAARVKLLSPESILERLKNSLNLLTSGAKDLPERQRTMRETIQWSYDLLDENEQSLFRRLAVFAGGFTVEAAELVCDLSESPALAGGFSAPTNAGGSDKPTLDLLTSLVENNLLTVKEQENDDARLQMLEVVREFAAECLENSGEAENIRRRHAEFFLALAEETEPLLLTENVVRALEKLDAEHDNLRAALRWLLSREVEMMARMTAALRQFWYNRCYLTEARQWLETALAKSNPTPNPTRLKLLNAFSLVTRTQGDYAATRRASEESLAASREIKDLRQIILACHAVAGLEIREKNLAAARKLFEESLFISRELNDERQIAFSLSGLSNVLLNEGKASVARTLLEEALLISRRMGFKFNLSTDLINLGAVNYYESDADAAYLNFAESLAIAREIKNAAYISCCLDGFAAVAAISKNPEQSARLAGAAECLRESIGYEIEPTERLFRDNYLVKTRSALDEKAFASFYAQGKAMNSEQAIALAESLISLSREQETEIIIETHKLERIFIEEEIVEFENEPKLVKEVVSSNEKQGVLAWLKKNFVVIIVAFLVLAAIGGVYFWLNARFD